MSEQEGRKRLPTVAPNEAIRPLATEFRESVLEVWRFRDMLYQLTLRDIRIKYKQALLGFGWAVFMPAMIVLAGCLIRFAIMRVNNEQVQLATIAALAIKALGWSFFVGTATFATSSLTGNSQLVTKVYFPRAVLPLASTLAQSFDTVIGAAVLVLALPLLGARWSSAILWVPLLVVLLFFFTVASSLFLSCANLFYRDVKYIVQVLLTFGIFFTPVFFEPAMLGPRLGALCMLNPLAPILEGLRLTIVDGHNLLTPLTATSGAVVWSPLFLLYATLWATLGLGASATLFHRTEFVFAEYA